VSTSPPPKGQRFFQLPWRSRSRIARDVDTELSFHLEMRVSELVAQGLSPSDAELRAREEFGDIETTRRYCRNADSRAERETRLTDRVAEWRQDLRYAFRTTRRSPGFAIVSLITLALAIGANTAIFSVAHAVLLAPLPFGDPGSLVALTESSAKNPADQYQLAPANYVDYKAQQHSFSDIAEYRGLGAVTWLPDHGDAEIVNGVIIAPNFFSVLQAHALLGRTLVAGDQSTGATPTVVISSAFWQHAFGRDPSVIGHTVMLNGHAYQLVGVMQPSFTLGMGEDVWLPYDIRDDLKDVIRARRQHYLRAIGRLKPGATVNDARTDLATIARRLELQYPEANKDRSATAIPLRESMTGGFRTSLLLLQGAAGLVLLIACANLANLTLSRTMSRRREIALRAAIGAGRARLTRQLLTESLLLAVVGGALGAALAAIATPRMLALNPDALPPMFEIGVDRSVLLFSFALSLATGVLFGLIPALDAGRANLHDALKEGGRGAIGGGRGDRVRRALVVAQVALAVVLLIGAGLLVRSFSELTRVRMGFDASHVLTAQLRASGGHYDSASAVNQFYDGVLSELAHAPGVVAAGATDILPTDGNFTTTLRIEGEPVDETSLPEMDYISVRGDYFAALRIPILSGRAYDATDLPGGDSRVIINETAARRFFPNGDAIGRRIRIGPDPEGAWITIVGIAGDIRNEGVDLPTRPTLYANQRQEAWERSLAVVVRTSGDAATAAQALRAAVKRADPALAIRDIRDLDAVVGSSLGARRFSIGLAVSFAVVALILAAVGLYGVLAYSVTSRTKEFGVRLALGATARAVLVLVVREGVAWATLGLVLGVAAAIAAGRLISGLLFGITPLDASTYVVVALSLLLVVIAACLVPGVRATKVDPLTSMQAE
jgi:putative ABC transport system permease protein